MATQEHENNKKEFLEELSEYKNYWNAVHVAADKYSEKFIAGKVYVFIQGTTGSVIVDVAKEVSWDEQLVGIGGDIIGGVILASGAGTVLNVVLTSQGYSVGTILQNSYTNIKTDINGQYWKYETNQSFMVGGQMVTYDYVKIKCYANGDAIMDNATQSPVVEKISESVYKQNTKFELKDINFDDGAKIEFNEKNQIVSIEIDNQKVIYNNDGTATFPSDITEANPNLIVNIVNGVASLKSGQTISHIAVGTKYTTKELLQYNNLTEQQSKNLPIGYEVQIPKDINNLSGGYGNIKVYEGYDGSLTYYIPVDKDGNIKVVKLDKNGNVLQNEFDIGDTAILDEIKIIGNWNEANDPSITNEPTSSGKSYQQNLEEQKRKWLEENEADALSTQLGSTIGGSIGSLIISNNNFSNIEKIAISTSTTVVGQNVGEYIFWDKNNVNGSGAFDDIGADFKNTLQGAVVSFALSSFFAKNDTLGDILGMDGTFVGDFADVTISAGLGYATGMYIVSDFNTATTWANMNKVGTNGLTSLQAFSVGVVGGYLGNAFANKVMGWDSKEEALGASIGSAVGTTIVMATQGPLIASLLAMGPVGWIAAVFVAFGGSAIGNFIGGIIGGLFGKKSPPPPTAHAEYEFDEETQSYNLISSGSADGGNQQAMINIGKAFANHLENMFNIPGGQLVNSEFLPDININQRDKTVKINGEKGTFDTVNDMIGNLLIQNIPFINVENGDEYILRAINRTNDKFLETDIHDKSRANLDELYENISLASDYSKYKNETMVIVDIDGNLITDKNQLQTINTQFQTIQNIQDEKEKEKALKEFMEDYKFVTQKEYVDKLLKENNPNKQAEIDHWKKVFAIAEELQLDTHHYSEDFNKLNSEIAKYNYEQSELKGELVDIDYDKYLKEIEAKIAINNIDYKNKIFGEVG